MLHLTAPTDPNWGRFALDHLDEILLDHAHCEKKAASTALSLVFRYPDRPTLAVPLARLAREELEHFESVVGHLRRRRAEFCRQRPSPYAAQLMAAVARHEPTRLIDTLLCCSLIEARSCERMQILADALERERVDPKLGRLYRDLLACEARHHHAYVELARGLDLVSDQELRARLSELAHHESQVIRDAPLIGRLHAGPSTRLVSS